MNTIITPAYGYMPANCEFTQFWRNHDKAFERRRQTKVHLAEQAAIIRRRGGQSKKTDDATFLKIDRSPETIAHLEAQAAIIRSNGGLKVRQLPTINTQPAVEMVELEYPGCKGCDSPTERLMHNCL